MATRSPFFTPSVFRALATWHVRSRSCLQETNRSQVKLAILLGGWERYIHAAILGHTQFGHNIIRGMTDEKEQRVRVYHVHVRDLYMQRKRRLNKCWVGRVGIYARASSILRMYKWRGVSFGTL